jgi:hypothetical protein
MSAPWISHSNDLGNESTTLARPDMHWSTLFSCHSFGCLVTKLLFSTFVIVENAMVLVTPPALWPSISLSASTSLELTPLSPAAAVDICLESFALCPLAMLVLVLLSLL